MIKDVQDRVFEAGCLGQFGEHARRHGPAAERLPVRMPSVDGGMQLALGRCRAVRSGEPDRGEQQRLARIGEQPDIRPLAGDRGRQAKVEQRSAAGDMRCPAARIAVGQLPCRVGAQLDGAAGVPDLEPPRLGVVHRRRRRRRPQQLIDQLPRRGRRLGGSPAASCACLRHARSVTRRAEPKVGALVLTARDHRQGPARQAAREPGRRAAPLVTAAPPGNSSAVQSGLPPARAARPQEQPHQAWVLAQARAGTFKPAQPVPRRCAGSRPACSRHPGRISCPGPPPGPGPVEDNRARRHTG